eukprot:3514141-Amphidinium_carterae.1
MHTSIGNDVVTVAHNLAQAILSVQKKFYAMLRTSCNRGPTSVLHCHMHCGLNGIGSLRNPPQ